MAKTVRKPAKYSIADTDGSVGKLYLTFWDIVLDNLPEGRLLHRCITPAAARKAIAQARTQKKLRCVSGKDLIAPYSQHEFEKYEELCRLLSTEFDIPIEVNEFLSGYEREGERRYSINPLVAVKIRSGDRLLIVNCAYLLHPPTNTKKARDFLDRLKLSAGTATFHLIESTETKGRRAKKK